MTSHPAGPPRDPYDSRFLPGVLPAPAPYRPPSSARHTIWLWLAGVAAGGAAVVAIVESAGPDTPVVSGNGFEAIVEDCTIDDADSAVPLGTVAFTVANSSTIARPATLSIEYRDGDGDLLDTDTSQTKPIRPGGLLRAEESTPLDAGGTRGTCVITRVN